MARTARENAQVAKTNAKQAATNGQQLYLLTFNVLNLVAWFTILVAVFSHMSSSSAFAIIPDRWRSTWAILQSRASTLHAGIGPKVTWVQTAALLEPLHAILGLVKSNPATSTMQVASRLFIVHFILSSFPVVGASPFYASMVFAWSLTEVVRFATYASSQLGVKFRRLEWLRYNMFYLLYPLGAGSEAALMYLSLPYAASRFHHQGYWALTGLISLWPIALLYMMSHMHAQRRKHVSSARKGKKRA